MNRQIRSWLGAHLLEQTCWQLGTIGLPIEADIGRSPNRRFEELKLRLHGQAILKALSLSFTLSQPDLPELIAPLAVMPRQRQSEPRRAVALPH